ncbi:MAG: HemK/PrmC family methyltransferase [bacterium]|nr:HemK/PrmC family methyltransferase [bacterium]
MRENVKSWLQSASQKLKNAEIASADLDAELILARVLDTERTTLHAYPNRRLTRQQVFHANNWLNKRLNRVPLAYIFNEKEFFGRKFYINESVLVPRPETETLIEATKELTQNDDKILDVGTGSGIIPITLKLELPKTVEIFASDISLHALAVANLNTKRLTGKELQLFESNLLDKIPSEILSQITILTANLPYVDRNWVNFEAQNELHHEPQIALYAEKNGLELIFSLLEQAQFLPNLRTIILEADLQQFEQIEQKAAQLGFQKIKSKDYIIAFSK